MKIGLLGFGTVGSGVFEIIQSPALRDSGFSIEAALVRDMEKYRPLVGDKVSLVTDPYVILNNKEIQVIVEVLGGISEPFEYISYALKQKKHVVTANKAVLAAHMQELLTLAKENGVSLLYEASVGGGIPLIRPMAESAAINSFHEVYGILNGTSNFILTKMAKEGLEFSEALKIAQDAGFAEADPTDDIDGPDVARKISVLASTIFGKHLPVTKIPMNGIRHISKEDMAYAEERGCVIKLIGRAKISEEGYFASVMPEFIKKDLLPAQVHNEFNLGVARGNFLREVSFYGEGAGKFPTASAVVRDLLDIQGATKEPANYHKEVDFAPISVRPISGEFYLRIQNSAKSNPEELLREANIEYQRVDSVKDAYILQGKEIQKIEDFQKRLRENYIIYFLANLN